MKMQRHEVFAQFDQVQITRRAFLKGLAGLTVTISVAGCASSNNPPPATVTSTPLNVMHTPSATPVLGTRLYTYVGHYKPVNSVAWSPDGKYVASAGDDHTVHVLNVATGNVLFVYRGHNHEVASVVWSPDSTQVASGSGGELASSTPADTTVQIWEA